MHVQGCITLHHLGDYNSRFDSKSPQPCISSGDEWMAWCLKRTDEWVYRQLSVCMDGGTQRWARGQWLGGNSNGYMNNGLTCMWRTDWMNGLECWIDAQQQNDDSWTMDGGMDSCFGKCRQINGCMNGWMDRHGQMGWWAEYECKSGEWKDVFSPVKFQLYSPLCMIRECFSHALIIQNSKKAYWGHLVVVLGITNGAWIQPLGWMTV